MSIPKVIHYCWFGRGELPKLAKKCIQSWKKYCPDYEIICWNEDNFDVTQNPYMLEAYEAKKWAFVSDYARLKLIYDHGGIYFDTDVELCKPIDDLLEDGGFMGFDEKGSVATGLGFGAEKENRIVAEMLKDYEGVHFLMADGSFNLMPCPDRNTDTLKRLGMDTGNTSQRFMDMVFYPREYFCPMDYYTGKLTITSNTYSIHYYCASWISKVSKRTIRVKRIIGANLYNKIYGKFLQKCKWLEW